jgi:hypothetical protein
MRKRILVAILAVTLLFQGCGSSSELPIVFGTSFLKYDITGSDSLRFGLYMLSPTKETTVEVDRFIGTNVENLYGEVVLPEGAVPEDVDGEYLSYVVFDCTGANGSLQIDGLDLTVNGDKVSLVFPTPLKYSVTSDESENASVVLGGAGAPLFLTFDVRSMANGSTFLRSYTAYEDIVVEGFYLSSFLNVTDATVTKDGVALGTLEDILPLEVEEGASLEIQAHFDFDPNQGCTDLDVIAVDTVLLYRLQSNPDELLTNAYPLLISNSGVDSKVLVEYLRSTR